MGKYSEDILITKSKEELIGIINEITSRGSRWNASAKNKQKRAAIQRRYYLKRKAMLAARSS
jgi:hypothetical protein